MDILTDILNSAGLTKSLLMKRAFYKPIAVKFPCVQSMGFHVVLQGEAFLRSAQLKNPVQLKRGDVVMLKRGLSHEIATDTTAKVQNLPVEDFPVLLTKTPLVTIVSGLYQFQTEPIHPLFTEIPNIIIIRAEEISSHSPLFMAQQLLSAETGQTGPGSDAITKSLIDVLFHYIFRDWLEKRKTKTSSWSLALKDQHLKKAIEALHASPTKEWNLEELSKVAGLSRAAFAQKFKKITGDTPAHYLTRIRIQRAMDLLRTTDKGLEDIAENIGYGDSFVFSKAFKRILGVSPKEFRKQLDVS